MLSIGGSMGGLATGGGSGCGGGGLAVGGLAMGGFHRGAGDILIQLPYIYTALPHGALPEMDFPQRETRMSAH